MNTIHSILRANERAGMKYSEAVRFTDLAIRNGLRPEDLPRKERKYMESRETDAGCKTILYNGYIFIMRDEDICITMYAAPSWFLKKRHYDGKTRVRNAKKYLRYANPDVLEAA